MTKDEYEKLVDKFTAETVIDVIEFFDLKIASKGVGQWRKDHKSDYATILYWERNGWIRPNRTAPNPTLSTSSRGIMGWAERERERARKISEK